MMLASALTVAAILILVVAAIISVARKPLYELHRNKCKPPIGLRVVRRRK